MAHNISQESMIKAHEKGARRLSSPVYHLDHQDYLGDLNSRRKDKDGHSE